MASIIEFLTINIAVDKLDDALAKYRAMGFAPLDPEPMPDPPSEITHVSLPIGPGEPMSLIAALGPGSPVAKFIEREAEGPFSISLRTDDLKGLMAQWSAAGAKWVLPEPFVFPPNTPCLQYDSDGVLGNWVRRSSLFGVMLEIFELTGEVRRRRGTGA
jgi:catechol 2,3-dioxygenase-like lactoylglutathione lyase family enzyme